jgi:hypothetical protein
MMSEVWVSLVASYLDTLHFETDVFVSLFAVEECI